MFAIFCGKVFLHGFNTFQPLRESQCWGRNNEFTSSISLVLFKHYLHIDIGFAHTGLHSYRECGIFGITLYTVHGLEFSFHL